MAEQSFSSDPQIAAIQTRLAEIARRLRGSGEVDPESRHALAELVDELNTVLQKGQVPDAEVAHLAESTAHLAESLQQHQDRGLLADARDRFEGAVVRAETAAPTAVGLARRLLDALANIGI